MKRGETESFSNYKKRRTRARKTLDAHLNGVVVWKGNGFTFGDGTYKRSKPKTYKGKPYSCKAERKAIKRNHVQLLKQSQ